jgi:hypothetical protein
MKAYIVLFLLLTLTNKSWAQKQEIKFQVNFKDNAIGTLLAVQETSGTKSTKDLKTLTDTKVLMMAVHVESEVNVIHQDGVLQKGVAYRHANRGAEDVHATVIMKGDKNYQIERNGKTEKMIANISFCVVDLFFREPKGISKIFSNMYTKVLTLKEISPGTYMLMTPDNKNSYYTYQNGKLMVVETDTPLGKVVSRRI